MTKIEMLGVACLMVIAFIILSTLFAPIEPQTTPCEKHHCWDTCYLTQIKGLTQPYQTAIINTNTFGKYFK